MLDALKEAIVEADGEKVEELLASMADQVDWQEVTIRCIDPALDTLCSRIQANQGSVPELLMGLKQVARITARFDAGNRPRRTQRMVMGVVEGDIHDMGKNIIRDVCLGYGFQVMDIGRDVPVTAFVEAATQHQADLVCLSTMMSTTIEAMQTTIMQLKATRPGVRILVGGAFVNQEIAASIQADGYAENASTVVAEIARISQ